MTGLISIVYNLLPVHAGNTALNIQRICFLFLTLPFRQFSTHEYSRSPVWPGGDRTPVKQCTMMGDGGQSYYPGGLYAGREYMVPSQPACLYSGDKGSGLGRAVLGYSGHHIGLEEDGLGHYRHGPGGEDSGHGGVQGHQAMTGTPFPPSYASHVSTTSSLGMIPGAVYHQLEGVHHNPVTQTHGLRVGSRMLQDQGINHGTHTSPVDVSTWSSHMYTSDSSSPSHPQPSPPQPPPAHQNHPKLAVTPGLAHKHNLLVLEGAQGDDGGVTPAVKSDNRSTSSDNNNNNNSHNSSANSNGCNAPGAPKTPSADESPTSKSSLQFPWMKTTKSHAHLWKANWAGKKTHDCKVITLGPEGL